VSGKVVEVYPHNSESVTPGTPLLRLENPSIQWSYEQCQAALDELEILIRQARESNRPLLSALKRVEQTKLTELAQRQRELEQLQIKAPRAGTVHFPDHQVLSGLHLNRGTEIAYLYDFSGMVFRANISDRHASRLFEEAPSKILIKLEGATSTTLQGRLLSIEPAESNEDGNPMEQASFVAWIQIDSDNKLPLLDQRGGRVCFKFTPAPFGQQARRFLQQLFLRRMRTT